MKKLRNPREWLGTGIQLMIFALLLPYLSILLGIVMESAPDAKEKFASAVLSCFPFYDTLQNAITGYQVSATGFSMLRYIAVAFDTIKENAVAAMYLGSWIFAFRLLFKESILAESLKLRGLPILQQVCGLFMGALTYALLDNTVTAILATVFIMTLDFVLTIVFVHKMPRKKVFELIFSLPLQCYLACLTIGYVASLMSCLLGLYANVTQAITAIAMTTLLWIVYLVAQYLLFEK